MRTTSAQQLRQMGEIRSASDRERLAGEMEAEMNSAPRHRSAAFEIRRQRRTRQPPYSPRGEHCFARQRFASPAEWRDAHSQ